MTWRAMRHPHHMKWVMIMWKMKLYFLFFILTIFPNPVPKFSLLQLHSLFLCLLCMLSWTERLTGVPYGPFYNTALQYPTDEWVLLLVSLRCRVVMLMNIRHPILSPNFHWTFRMAELSPFRMNRFLLQVHDQYVEYVNKGCNAS